MNCLVKSNVDCHCHGLIAKAKHAFDIIRLVIN